MKKTIAPLKHHVLPLVTGRSLGSGFRIRLWGTGIRFWDLCGKPWDEVDLEELFPDDRVLQRIKFFPGDGDYRYKVYRDGTVAEWKNED